MGAFLSLPRRLFRMFQWESNPSPPSGVTAPQRPRPSQYPTSPAHSNHTEATEIIYPDHFHLQAEKLDKLQIVTINDNLLQTDVFDPESPYPLSGLPTTPLPSVPLFALIIGIDDYYHCPGLRGAVSDAKAMGDYLEEMLGVSEDHIRILLDHQATRDAIIEAFRDLQNDQRIRNGDPIVIFYAGHGGTLPAPHSWGVNGHIQCLVPCDYKAKNLHPIPDRTIGALIEDIARAKGNNITVIFDCCYSAGCARYDDEAYTPRTVDLDPNIPKNIDNDIWGSRAGAIPNSFAYHGSRSHVLLAACRENELAYEHKERGQFTDAVLTTLRTCAVHDLTYAEIIERVQIPKQHPQCEGLNRHCVLFGARVSTGKQALHAVHTTEDGRKYVIDAGLIHGIAHGVEMTLYSDLRPRLGIMMVDSAASIGNFETTVMISESEPHLRAASFAKLTRVGKLPLYLDQGINTCPILKETLRRMVGNGMDDGNFRIVDEAKEAKMEVAMENDLVIFRILDLRIKRFGLKKLPHATTLDSVGRVLAAAAHYHWYLNLTNEDKDIHTLSRKVVIDFFLLKKKYDDYGLPFYAPVKPGCCRKDPLLDDSDIIDFVVDPEAVYGIEIKNNTQHDLYLNAFLFNSSSFSIVSYYTQSGAGSPDAPLKRNGTFTIGYGPGGTAPFTYWLDESQDVDVGHLKIVFATRPVDLSDVAQVSPFIPAHGRQWEWGETTTATNDADARKAKLSVFPMDERPQNRPVDTWFTVDIPIVQRRSAAV